MILAVWDADNTATLIVAVVGFGGVSFTLLLNGTRAERDRLRELYAGGWAAIQAYKEFAFAVRRRDARDPGAERVRISVALSEAQKDLAYYDALISRDRSTRTAIAYRELVVSTRKVAGRIISESWNAPPILFDSEIHAPAIAKRLEELKPAEDAYLNAAADETAPWWGVRAEIPRDAHRATPDKGHITEDC